MGFTRMRVQGVGRSRHCKHVIEVLSRTLQTKSNAEVWIDTKKHFILYIPPNPTLMIMVHVLPATSHLILQPQKNKS